MIIPPSFYFSCGGWKKIIRENLRLEKSSFILGEKPPEPFFILPPFSINSKRDQDQGIELLCQRLILEELF